jgi:large subunit ribosomal protein L6
VSRIGKQQIDIPGGVDVRVNGRLVTVKGPRGELSHTVPSVISTEIKDGALFVKRTEETKEGRSLHGLTRSLIANMVHGVTSGFSKTLEIIGVGYRADVQGQNLTLALGFSHPIVFQAPPEIKLEMGAGNRITISGIDKQLVGQVAAIIRSLKKPEPYKGKGIRYEGETVRRKAGKSGSKK